MADIRVVYSWLPWRMRKHIFLCGTSATVYFVLKLMWLNRWDLVFFLKDLSQGDYNSIGGVCVRRKHIFCRVTAAVTFCLAFYTSFI